MRTLGRVAVATVLWIEARWLWLVTACMPAEPRERYREERRAHVADHVEHDESLGRSSIETAAAIFVRFIAGVPADVAACARRSRPLRAKGASKLVLVLNVALLTIVLVTIARRSPPDAHAKEGALLALFAAWAALWSWFDARPRRRRS